jgi:hypothetical protein
MGETQEKSVVESESKEKRGNTITQLDLLPHPSSIMVTTGVIQGTGDKG